MLSEIYYVNFYMRILNSRIVGDFGRSFNKNDREIIYIYRGNI